MKFLQQISSVIIAIVSLVLPLGVIMAQSRDYVCSTRGYTIATINGIFTDKDGAIDNKDALKNKLPGTYKNEKLTVDFLLNPPHLGGLGDLAMVAYQKAFENEDVRDYDLIEMHRSANEKIKTQKLLLVAHSQGNFYANSFYDTVVNDPESISSQSIGVYAVATPASKVAGDGKWITSGTDNTIIGYVGGVLGRKILPPNVYIKEFSAFSPKIDYGHSFVDAYLKYEGSRVVSDIKESLSKLSADENRRGDAPCIGAPAITTAHNIEGAILAVLDHPLDTAMGAVQNAAYASMVTGKSAFYAISLFAKTTERLASAAISSSLSVYRVLRNNSNDTINNSASVLLATTPQQENIPAPDTTKQTESTPIAPLSQVANEPVAREAPTALQANSSPVSVTTLTQTETLSAEVTAPKLAHEDTSTIVLSGFDLGGGATLTQTISDSSASKAQASQTETNNTSSVSLGGNTATTTSTTATSTTAVETTTTTSTQTSSTTPDTATTTPAILPEVTPLHPASIIIKTSPITFSGTYKDIDGKYNLLRIDIESTNNSMSTGSEISTHQIPFAKGTSIPFSQTIEFKKTEKVDVKWRVQAWNYNTWGYQGYDTKVNDASGYSDWQYFTFEPELPVVAATSTTSVASSTVSSAHAMTNFSLIVATSTLIGTIDETAHTIKLTVPFGTDLKRLASSVTISPLATVNPASGTIQDFTNPVTYTITAEDGSTQTYIVTVVVAPSITLPAITSYTFNGVAGDITVNLATTTELITPPVTINLTANKNVDWVSVTIEDQNNPSNYKRFLSGVGCVDGTSTCEKTWDGKLSRGATTSNSIYRVKAHLKDTAGNEYNDYLLPYRITVN